MKQFLFVFESLCLIAIVMFCLCFSSCTVMEGVLQALTGNLM